MDNGSDEVLGRRIVAALVDILLLGVVFVLLGILTGGAHSRSGSHSGSASVTLGPGASLAFLLVAAAYYFGCERTTGQTVGKRLLGIRVRGQNETSVTTREIALRTLLRVLDALPLLYLVGFVTMMATGTRRQRIGDLVARTSVTR